jgi:hypothetical protein
MMLRRKASTALNSCSADLGHAVQFLLDAGAYSRKPVPLWTGG